MMKSRQRRHCLMIWGFILALSGLALSLAEQPRPVQEAQALWIEGSARFLPLPASGGAPRG